MKKKVLAVGAHFDDVELGCGGTLANHVDQGDEVTVFVATHSGYSDPNQREIRSKDVARNEGVKGAEILGFDLLCGEWETKLIFTQVSRPTACSGRRLSVVGGYPAYRPVLSARLMSPRLKLGGGVCISLRRLMQVRWDPALPVPCRAMGCIGDEMRGFVWSREGS